MNLYLMIKVYWMIFRTRLWVLKCQKFHTRHHIPYNYIKHPAHYCAKCGRYWAWR